MKNGLFLNLFSRCHINSYLCGGFLFAAVRWSGSFCMHVNGCVRVCDGIYYFRLQIRFNIQQSHLFGIFFELSSHFVIPSNMTKLRNIGTKVFIWSSFLFYSSSCSFSLCSPLFFPLSLMCEFLHVLFAQQLNIIF